MKLLRAGFFGQFVSKPVEPLIWFFIFATATTVIILLGVDKGIEKMSRFLMPALVVLTVALSIFVVTRPGAKAGVEYYLKPDFSKLSVMTFIAKTWANVLFNVACNGHYGNIRLLFQ